MNEALVPDELALLLAEIPPLRPTSIVDVGANPVHLPPYDLLRKLNACHVVGFEPQPEAFAALEQARQPNETYFNLAIGDNTTHDLHIYRAEGMTSIFRPNLPGLRSVGMERFGKVLRSVPMQTVALDSIDDLPAFDLLKIDIQGCEKLAFQGARRVLGTAIAVIVELRYLRLYEGEPMLGGVDEELLQQGFGLHKFLFNKAKMMHHSQADRVRQRAMRDQLIDGDAVYLRSLAEPQALTDDQLKHLAILASCVFLSQSVVIYCLDELVRRGAASDSLPHRYVDALPAHFRKETTP